MLLQTRVDASIGFAGDASTCIMKSHGFEGEASELVGAVIHVFELGSPCAIDSKTEGIVAVDVLGVRGRVKIGGIELIDDFRNEWSRNVADVGPVDVDQSEKGMRLEALKVETFGWIGME